MVSNLGFGAFAAWEDIRGQRLGYLASDDESLMQPLEQFISAVTDQPFAVVLLTSATHHFYQLSDASSDRAAAANRSSVTREDRYERLVETADVLLARLLDLLDARTLTSDTLVIVLGDHGEGFGDQGVRQHDSNYFEEGLNVPWVMVGPAYLAARSLATTACLM